MPGALGASCPISLASLYPLTTPFHPSLSRIRSILTPPGRNTTGGSQSPSTTVLSTPTWQDPPSSMISILPFKSWSTCAALVGDGFVEAFAEGAASGTPARWMRESASGEFGIRAPKVGRPAVTSGASLLGLGFGRRIVRGPGQNLFIRGL